MSGFRGDAWRMRRQSRLARGLETSRNAPTMGFPCTVCSKGHYSPGGYVLCKKCETGKYNNQTGQSKCKICPTDKPYTRDGMSGATSIASCTSKLVCPANYYKVDGKNLKQCTKCPFDKPYTTFRNGKYNGATSLDMCIGTIPCKPGDGVKNLPTSIGKCKKYIDGKEECEKAAALYNIAGGVTSHSTPWEPRDVLYIHKHKEERQCVF